jgi:aminopeptidase N
VLKYWFVVVVLLWGGGLQAHHRDAHSFSNVHQVSIHHLRIALTVDFTRQQLSGTVEHWLQRLDPAANRLVLDTKGLRISKVEISADGQHWQPTQYLLGLADPLLGQPLNIRLQPNTLRVRVHYQTGPDAVALQWLKAHQTTEKKQPFLYTQSQSIHARSWLPLQDTPAIRQTFDSTIITPPQVLAVMSADNSRTDKASGVHHFAMPQPIPSSLIALAAGDLHFKAMSHNTGVYAELSYLDKAVAEFTDIGRMMETANRLYGPYPWYRYDLLVLPASYPYGGMENPRLAFVTPTIITGDKSLMGLVAHQFAHSWSGNLVNQGHWDHVWLNEGFTNYVEQRIMQEVYGPKRAALELQLYLQQLEQALVSLPSADQRLLADYSKRHPDDAFNPVNYVKGQLMLMAMAKHTGTAVFDQFLARYFAHFAFQAVTTEDFIEYARAHLDGVNKLPDNFFADWLHNSGLPAGAMPEPVLPVDQLKQVQQQWLYGDQQLDHRLTANWTMQHWLLFLNALPAQLNAAKLAQLDAQYHFSQSANPELFTAFAVKAIQVNYQPIVLPLQQFLQQNGRLKFLLPLYQQMKAQPQWRQWASSLYRNNRDFYHVQARQQLDKLAL